MGPARAWLTQHCGAADSTTARDDLNLRLKRRVWFQPFCPSILLSKRPRCWRTTAISADANLHMTMGYLTTPRGRAALAGATGPDGSCRPQMYRESADPWYRLLAHVRTLTGTGAVINTSLNLHGKPMSDAAAGIIEAWEKAVCSILPRVSAVIKDNVQNHEPI